MKKSTVILSELVIIGIIGICKSGDGKYDYIVAYEPYAVEVTNVTTNKDGVTTVTLSVKEAGKVAGGGAVPLTVKSDTYKDAYKLVSKYAKNDRFVACFQPGWEVGGADLDAKLLAVDDVTTVEGTVNAISTKSGAIDYDGWVNVDGTRYKFANEYSQETITVKDESTIYLYNGYVVDYKLGAASEDYVFVVGVGDEQGDGVVDVKYKNVTATKMPP